MTTRNMISFDWALKRLLRNKANFGILEGFLSELLRQKITLTNILESESNQEHENDKYNRVDIFVEADDHRYPFRNHCNYYRFTPRAGYGDSKKAQPIFRQ